MWMLKVANLCKVTNDDGTKNITKMAIIGTAGVLAASYASYKLYTYLDKRPSSATHVEKPQGTGSAQTKSSQGKSKLPSKEEDVDAELAVPLKYKDQGNRLFKQQKYKEARELYDKALAACPADQTHLFAIIHQNQAATSDMMKDWDDVVTCCSNALRYNKSYQKAYARRGKAYLALGDYDNAINDTAIAYYIGGTQNKVTRENYEKALEAKTDVVSDEYMRNRKAVPCSAHMVKGYINNFKKDPVLESIITFATVPAGEGRSPFNLACADIINELYDKVLDNLSEELKLQDTKYLKETLLLRSAFHVLAGLSDKALVDINRLLEMEDLEPEFISSALLRRALIHMAQMDAKRCIADMNAAEKADPNNGDIFHHRGQINLLMQNVDQSLKDTNRAIELHGPDVPNLQCQKEMCELQVAQLQGNMVEFEQAIDNLAKLTERYPKDVEVWCLNAQVLMAASKFREAGEMYTKALAVVPPESQSPIYIQKALMVISWKRDIPAGITHLQKAKSLDPYCETVHENLGQCYLQQNKLTEAIASFEEHRRLGRNRTDVKHATTMISSIKAQIHIKETLGLEVQNIFMT